MNSIVISRRHTIEYMLDRKQVTLRCKLPFFLEPFMAHLLNQQQHSTFTWLYGFCLVGKEASTMVLSKQDAVGLRNEHRLL